MRKTAIRKTNEKMDWRKEILMGPEQATGPNPWNLFKKARLLWMYL
jgi:hypothetical protein